MGPAISNYNMRLILLIQLSGGHCSIICLNLYTLKSVTHPIKTFFLANDEFFPFFFVVKLSHFIISVKIVQLNSKIGKRRKKVL